MDPWTSLLGIIILFLAALLLGAVAESLKQSSIIGYLIAGMLVGPNMLGLVQTSDEVSFIAELGVTLLLFSIGLEFSLRRLIRIGNVTYIGGTLQVILTALAGLVLARAFGMDQKAAIAMGLAVSLSSTACVIRLLVDRAQLDSLYGRNALGILLLQDIAVVPLMLVTAALGGGRSPVETAASLGITLAAAGGVFIVFYLLFNHLVPKLLSLRSLYSNRELPVLLAATVALGSAWAAHEAGLSPSFGSFLAGLLLAESPFATQIRADVASLRTLLVTLFFAAIGMMINPVWIAANALPVFVTLALVVLIKPLIVFIVVRLLGHGTGPSLATGLTLGQIGEFSFVLAEIAFLGAVIDNQTFRLVISVTALSLIVAPYMIQAAPALSCFVERCWRNRRGGGSRESGDESGSARPAEGPVILIGFGPAGQRAAETLLPRFGRRILVLDINPSNAEWASGLGLSFQVGDARHREVLEHLDLHHAEAVVVTLPDPMDVRHIVDLVKSVSPETRLFVRARYHIFRWELFLAGADSVVDEESQVGQRLAEETIRLIDMEKPARHAP